MSREALVRVGKRGITGLLEFSQRPIDNQTTFWSLDLILRSPPSSSAGLPILDITQDSSSLPTQFLVSALDSLSDTKTLRYLFPSTSGYVIRNDFLERRLEHSTHVLRAKTFLSPLQHVTGHIPPNSTMSSTLLTTISSAAGAILLHPSATLRDLDATLQNRLSIAMLLPERLHPRRIAWVQGREDLPSIGRALESAAALGIKLVVFDETGHWLQDDGLWSHLREAFVELDITPDVGLPQRVADAVRAYPAPIDGVVTISDGRLPYIAAACELLGLPTESARAYEIAGNKARTRLLEPGGGDESVVVPYGAPCPSPASLPPFPLVVKPAKGWSSDCVHKVRNAEELDAVVRKAAARHQSEVVVEPYIDGPEVDANLVLSDGEILFFEASDDFPSPADAAAAGGPTSSFQETQNVIPSALPAQEVSALREHVRTSVVRMGFTSGVFHCEARVRNSTVRYGAQDLEPREPREGNGEPQVYLHEVNARPPGYLESLAVGLAYGVDYYALRLLLSLGTRETARLQALALPFTQGPQFHMSVMIIQQTAAGVMQSVDAAAEFLERHPHVKSCAVDWYSRKKRGDVLEGPAADELWWIAYFTLVSRVSRGDLLEMVEFVQRNFEYVMVDEEGREVRVGPKDK